VQIVPGPIPLPITHLFCLADGKQCQHLGSNGVQFKCAHEHYNFNVNTLMTAQNRLSAPSWCPLREKE
jgi:hypothetical protein